MNLILLDALFLACLVSAGAVIHNLLRGTEERLMTVAVLTALFYTILSHVPKVAIPELLLGCLLWVATVTSLLPEKSNASLLTLWASLVISVFTAGEPFAFFEIYRGILIARTIFLDLMMLIAMLNA